MVRRDIFTMFPVCIFFLLRILYVFWLPTVVSPESVEDYTDTCLCLNIFYSWNSHYISFMEQSLHFFFLFTLVGRYSFQLWDERVERIVLVTCLQEEWYKCWRFINNKKLKSKCTRYSIKWVGNLCLLGLYSLQTLHRYCFNFQASRSGFDC